MSYSCFVENSGTARMKEMYTEDKFYEMASFAKSGNSPKLKDRRTSRPVLSPLFNDIYRELSHINQEERGIEAFNLYIEAYTDEFIEKHGDWTQFDKSFKSGRYSSTGEPKVNTLEITKPKKYERNSALDKAKSFLENTVKELETRIKIVQNKVSSTDNKEEIQRLNELLDGIRKSLEKNQIELGVIGYLNYLNNDVIPSYKDRVANVDTSKAVDSRLVNDIGQFVEDHNESILRLKRALESSKEYYHFYKAKVEPVLKEIQLDISDLNSFTLEQSKTHFADIAQEIHKDKSREEVEGWVTKTVKDIKGFSRYFGIPKNLNDPAIRLVARLISDIQYKVNRIIQGPIEDLVEKQVAMDKANIDTSIVKETYKGKKTPFLISDRKFGEYYSVMGEIQQRFMDAIGVKSWDEAKLYIGSMTAEEGKENKDFLKYKEEWEEFKKKYQTFENGEWKANPPKNEEFEKLMKNKAFAEYYNLLYDIHTKAKESQPIHYRTGMNWWMIPQISKRELTELVKTEGLQGVGKYVKRGLKEFSRVTEEDLEFGDLTRDEEGNVLKMVPLHYNSRLENVDDLSDDITAMYYSYYKMATNFRQSAEHAPDIELIHRAVGNREVPTPNSYKALENIIKAHIYGQKVEEWKFNIGNREYNGTKILRKLFVEYPRTVNMLFNVPVGLSGMMKSIYDTQLENVVGTFTTYESAKEATTEYATQIINVAAEIGKKKKTNKLDHLLRFNQLDDVIGQAYQKMNIDTQAGRMVSSNLAYINMLPTSYSRAATLALSFYFNYRLVDGEFITKRQFNKKYKNTDKKWSSYKKDSLYNAYEVRDGKFQVKPEYSKYITEDFEMSVSRKIKELGNRVEGKMSSFDKGDIYRTALGQAVMLHRNWIPQLASQRFKGRNYDLTMEQDEEGFYRTVGRVLFNMFSMTDGNMKFKAAKWNELEEFEKDNFKKFGMELLLLIATVILAKAINNLADDDEEDKWFIEFSAYLTSRMLLEQRAFTNPMEFFSILKSPAAAINQWQKIAGLGGLVFNWNETIQSGPYKDMTKGNRFLIQQSLLKNLYEIQYPKAKNTYLKSQILGK
jgi:hypothetical protein